MINEHRSAPETTGEFIDPKEAITAEEIQEYYQFADPILNVDWGDDGIPKDSTPEFIANNPEFSKVFIVRDRSGNIIAGSKITKIISEDKIRLGLDAGTYKDLRGALLEYTAIRSDYRNKNILTTLTQKRLDWAREQHLDFVCTELTLTNTHSLWTKFRDGFKLVDIREPGAGITEPYLVATKLLGSESELERGVEWQEITVSENSYTDLKKMFEDGWVGVDMKGVGENPETISVPWTLVLERHSAVNDQYGSNKGH